MSVRLPDFLGACLALIIVLPLFLIIPILIKLDSPGPVFYRQVRTGRNRRRRQRRAKTLAVGRERRGLDRRGRNLYGKPFHIYKFRTMNRDAERRSGPVWAMQDDPRITRIGRWLRKTHLDELPQLWNVLRGDMSLIGPRPERPEIITTILSDIPDYRQRLLVKPGVTGLAQLCWGYDSCLDDVRKKLQFDLLYITTQSWRMRLRILFYTMMKALTPALMVDLEMIEPQITIKATSVRERMESEQELHLHQ